MLILEAHGIKKYFGTRLIFDIKDLVLYAGDRVGLLGRNGVGKTTLLKVLTGEMSPDEGSVAFHGECAYLPQFNSVEDLHSVQSTDLAQQKEWLGKTEVHSNMSGGEVTRYKLAQLFSNDVHLLLADEPTSNLDIGGIKHLEQQLGEFPGALMIVSHDRELLDNACTQIWELEAGHLTCYPGNYSSYLEQKELRSQTKQAEYEQYTKEKRRLERAVIEKRNQSRSVRKAPSRMGNSEARLHKGAAKGKRAKLERAAKTLETRLDQLEVKEKPKELDSVSIDIQPPTEIHGSFALQVNGLSKSFPGRELFHDAHFEIRTGKKVALIGDNGTGKTTLLDLIVHKVDGVFLPASVKLGYFSQKLDILDPGQTVLENVLDVTSYPESFVRLILARLLFKGDEVHKQVSLLSGGERVKCSFAKIFLQDVNFLILDEPTNYLDVDSREALAKVLSSYAGTVLMASHDRRFIDQVADHILVLQNQEFRMFQGNYTEYVHHTKKQREDGAGAVDSEQLLVLENRLAELTGRLSMPRPNDDLELLDQEFKDVVSRIRRMKDRLSQS